MIFESRPDYPTTCTLNGEPFTFGTWRVAYRVSRSWLPPRDEAGRWAASPVTLHVLVHSGRGSTVVIEEGFAQGDPTSRFRLAAATMAVVVLDWSTVAGVVEAWADGLPDRIEAERGTADAVLVAMVKQQIPVLVAALAVIGAVGMEVSA